MARLDVQKLSLAYGAKTILHEVDLELNSGEVLALVGPNGAGKTSLIKAISGVLPPEGGRVLVDGLDVAGLTPTERARRMAVVSQARELPGAFSVQQVVMVGRTPYLGWLGTAHPADQAAVERALEATQAGQYAASRVGELSGGEQQRVLLARALAQETPLLLLDEPTVHLDLQHQSQFLNLLQESVQARGLAVLLALHDLNLVAQYANRVALLVDGRIRVIGTPGQVLTKANIEKAYGVTVKVIEHPDYGTPLVLPDGRKG